MLLGIPRAGKESWLTYRSQPLKYWLGPKSRQLEVRKLRVITADGDLHNRAAVKSV